jgi:hypothetical protein
MDFLNDIFSVIVTQGRELLPYVAGAAGVVVTAALKRGGSELNAKIPNAAKPVITQLAGIFLASLVGGSPVEGLVCAVAANKVRDAAKGL